MQSLEEVLGQVRSTVKKLLLAAAMLAILCVAHPAAAACAHVHTETQVTEDISPPKVDLSRTAAEIEALKFGAPLTADPKFTLIAGLTVADISLGQHIRTIVSGPEDGPFCVWPSVVAVQLLTAPNIYVDASHGACRRDAALAHELEHAAIDQRLIQRYAPIFERRIRQMAEAIGTAEVASKGGVAAARERIEAKIVAVLSVTYEEMGQERLAAQRSHDSPEEYRRLSVACPADAH
jgi:hypothetical protein